MAWIEANPPSFGNPRDARQRCWICCDHPLQGLTVPESLGNAWLRRLANGRIRRGWIPERHWRPLNSLRTRKTLDRQPLDHSDGEFQPGPRKNDNIVNDFRGTTPPDGPTRHAGAGGRCGQHPLRRMAAPGGPCKVSRDAGETCDPGRFNQAAWSVFLRDRTGASRGGFRCGAGSGAVPVSTRWSGTRYPTAWASAAGSPSGQWRGAPGRMTCRRPSGRACIGAMQFLPQGADPGDPFRIERSPQSEAEVASATRDPATSSSASATGLPGRSSTMPGTGWPCRPPVARRRPTGWSAPAGIGGGGAIYRRRPRNPASALLAAPRAASTGHATARSCARTRADGGRIRCKRWCCR